MRSLRKFKLNLYRRTALINMIPVLVQYPVHQYRELSCVCFRSFAVLDSPKESGNASRIIAQRFSHAQS